MIPGFTEEEIRYYTNKYGKAFIDYEKAKGKKKTDPKQTTLEETIRCNR